MGWGEAVRLTQILCSDTSCQLAAHLNGWQRPFEWCEWAVLDMLDHYRSANSEGQPEPVARPTDERRARFTSGQVDDILARVRAGGGVSREIDIMG